MSTVRFAEAGKSMKRIEKIQERDGARERLLTLLMSLDMEKIERIFAVVLGIILGQNFLLKRPLQIRLTIKGKINGKTDNPERTCFDS